MSNVLCHDNNNNYDNDNDVNVNHSSVAAAAAAAVDHHRLSNNEIVTHTVVTTYSCLGAVAMYNEELKIHPQSLVSSVHGVSYSTDDVEMEIQADDTATRNNNCFYSKDHSSYSIRSNTKSIYNRRTSNLNPYPIYSPDVINDDQVQAQVQVQQANEEDMEDEYLVPMEYNDGEVIGQPPLTLRHSISAPSLANTSTVSSNASASSSLDQLMDTSLHSATLDAVPVPVSCRTSFSTGNLCELGDDTFMTKTKSSRRRVSLARSVSVVPIPSRYEYPDIVRCRLWSNPLEMYQNAARNSIEFAYEGWDWRAVYEDDSMCVCSQSGELIHPIHVYLNSVKTEEVNTDKSIPSNVESS